MPNPTVPVATPGLPIAIDPALAAIAEYMRLRGLTEAALEEYRAAIAAGDFKETEERFSRANGAMFSGLVTALKMQPTTTDGAVSLMRLVAENIEEMAEDERHRPTLIAAIRSAANVIEGARS